MPLNTLPEEIWLQILGLMIIRNDLNSRICGGETALSFSMLMRIYEAMKERLHVRSTCHLFADISMYYPNVVKWHEHFMFRDLGHRYSMTRPGFYGKCWSFYHENECDLNSLRNEYPEHPRLIKRDALTRIISEDMSSASAFFVRFQMLLVMQQKKTECDTIMHVRLIACRAFFERIPVLPKLLRRIVCLNIDDLLMDCKRSTFPIEDFESLVSTFDGAELKFYRSSDEYPPQTLKCRPQVLHSIISAARDHPKTTYLLGRLFDIHDYSVWKALLNLQPEPVYNCATEFDNVHIWPRREFKDLPSFAHLSVRKRDACTLYGGRQTYFLLPIITIDRRGDKRKCKMEHACR